MINSTVCHVSGIITDLIKNYVTTFHLLPIAISFLQREIATRL